MRRERPILLVLATSLCAACVTAADRPSRRDPALRVVERGLERAYFNRFVSVGLRRHVGVDTLVVRFEGGKDMLGGGPGREAEFRAAAAGMAAQAARLAGAALERCAVIQVEFVRTRRLGVLVWGAGRETVTFPARALRDDAEAAPASCGISTAA